MLTRKRTFTSVACSALVAIGGCPTGQVIGTILALQTFVFVLGQTGVLDVRAGNSQPTRSAGVFSLNLPDTAADEPDSAQLQMGTVRALPLDDTSKALQQTLSGTAQVDVYCASSASSNPCNDGVLVGRYALTISGGTVTVSNPSLTVPSAALPFLISGEFGVCFEVTASIDVRIVIEDMLVTFGEDNGPNPAPVDNDPQPNDSDVPNDNNDTPVADTPQDETPSDRVAPQFSACPQPLQVDADESGMYSVPDFGSSAGASDNSGSVSVSQDPSAGSRIGIGMSTVRITARDASGNTTVCEVDVDVQDPGPTGGGFTKAFIRHAGSEQIIAGSDIDPDFGLVTRSDFTVAPQVFDRWNKSYALSGFGTRIWFRMLAPFSVEGQDRTQIWSINSDGSGAQRSPLPSELRDVFGAHLETNEDGSVCILNMDAKIQRTRPGETLEELYDFAGEFDFRSAYKIDDDAERCWLVDLDGRGVHSIDLNARPYFPTVIITRENQAINGRDPRALAPQEFDLAGDFPAYVFRRNYDLGGTVESPFRFQDVFWFGSGLVAPASLDNIIQDVAGRKTPYDLNISDDGLTFGYCQNVNDLPGLDPAVPCFVESVDGKVTQVGDGRTRMGGFTMSDNAARVFYVDSASFGGSNGIIEDVGTGRKVAAGTVAFGPNWDGEFVRVDDIGRTFVTNCDAGGSQGGLYVLTDGNSLRSGFPKIDGIYYRFEDECTLRIRVQANGPRGIGRMLVMPLNDGVNPTAWVEGELNPYFAIRNPPGNRMEPIEDAPGWWEFSFALTNSRGDCAQDQLTRDFTLRIVAVDSNETVTVFEEFSPLE